MRSEQIALGAAASEDAATQEAKQGIHIPADPKEAQRLIETLRKEMFDAAAKREYELAAERRDSIKAIQESLLLR